MTDFRLAGLNPYLLEKIITKLDSKSYFRMRQTCRGMDEFIRKSRNISIYTYENRDRDSVRKSSYRVQFDKNEPHQLRMIDFNETEKDVELFYGTRFRYLNLPEKTFGQFDRLCDVLKTHRITCEHLWLADSRKSKLTKEELGIILNIVKPRSVQLDSVRSNRYEAVFQSKTLKQVRIMIGEDEIYTVVPRLLVAFPEVFIDPFMPSNMDWSLLLKMLQILNPQPPASLRQFRFAAYGGFHQFYQRWEEQLLGLGFPTVQEEPGEYFILVPNGFSIRIIFGDYVSVCYREGYPDSVV